MKVVLTKDVEGWGTIGDVIEVKKGFARNYLIPRGLALELTEENKRFIDNILAQKARKLQREKEKALELAKKLNGVEIEIERPIGVTGKMYGSVTISDIAEKLKEKGIEVGTELEFVIMVIAVSCVKLLSAHNSTQHTSRKHKV
jgi:LSU ribosomal protein L9P